VVAPERLPRYQHNRMTLALCFWVLMLLWFVWGCTDYMKTAGPIGQALKTVAPNVLLFILLLLLGWQTFGPPLHR
jgi:hypothetical protein